MKQPDEMTDKIDNVWLERIAQRTIGDGLPLMTDYDIIKMAQELLTARQTMKRLFDDGEMLAFELEVQGKINKINSNEFDDDRNLFVEGALSQHASLMKEMEDK